MLAHQGEYGFVTSLSRATGVSRQTLYSWKEQGWRALQQAFQPASPATPTPALQRQILTLLLESHPSYRGIQTCLWRLTRQKVSLATIVAVIEQAQRRALEYMAGLAPPCSRTLALDEIYGRKRRGAYLNVVDCASYAVWVAEGPLPVDAETWTLLLWLAQDKGLRWHATVTDGGPAMLKALGTLDPERPHGRDLWHVLKMCAQVQARLERHLSQCHKQTATVKRQIARLAAGQQPRGRNPRTDLAAVQAEVALAVRLVEGLRYLSGQLHEILEVVVLRGDRVLNAAARESELESILSLLSELAEGAGGTERSELRRLHKHLVEAKSGLLRFVWDLEKVQNDMQVALGSSGMALVGWAWQHRALLAEEREELLSFLPQEWQAAARVLMSAWDQAVRASSAVENWHSIVRPHLAVHRGLTRGMLALLAVWHNHRVFTRGVHIGYSPLQLSGISDAPCDWLVALGYPPEQPPACCLSAAVSSADLALAA
jgi:hypothetical protein